MKFILASIVSLFLISPSLGYYYPANFYYSRPSTVAGSYLQGQAAYLWGQSEYLRGLGQYEIYHQNAVEKAIKNNTDRIHAYWEIKDQYKERTAHESWLTKEEHRMDNAERAFALKQRENNMILEGKLSPRVTSYCVIHGKAYESWSQWKASTDYKIYKIEQQEKWILAQVDKLRAEEARRNSFFYANTIGRMSLGEKQRYDVSKRIATEKGAIVLHKPEFEDIETKVNIYFNELERIRGLKDGLIKAKKVRQERST